MSDQLSEVDLLDWKRRIFALYQDIRSSIDPASAWNDWRQTRDDMFRSHPQSPIPASDREGFNGLTLYDYDPTY